MEARDKERKDKEVISTARMCVLWYALLVTSSSNILNIFQYFTSDFIDFLKISVQWLVHNVHELHQNSLITSFSNSLS